MEKVNSKVLVLGEYNVLHNGMALTIPYNKFSGMLSYPEDSKENAVAVPSNKGIRKFCNYLLENHFDEAFKLNVRKFSQELDKGLFFKSNIPQGFGLGSSGALVAAVFLRYLNKAGELKEELKNMTFEKAQNLKAILGALENYFHGKSSGIDPLSILINEPILLKDNKEIIKVAIPKYDENGKNVIFLLNTKLTRNSEELIAQFNNSCKNAEFKQKLEQQLIRYTNQGIEDFLRGDTVNFYKNLENLSRFQLEEMSFLIPKGYHDLIRKGLETKDYFLKICGSGGGGYMIGFTDKWMRTQQILNEELEELYKF